MMAAELQKGLADLEVSRQLSTTEAEAFLQRFSLADMTRYVAGLRGIPQPVRLAPSSDCFDKRSRQHKA